MRDVMRKRIAPWQWMGCALLIAGTLGGLLLGCGPSSDDAVSETEEGDLVLGRAEATRTDERVVAPGERPLVFTGFRGTVRIDGDTSDAARLTFVQRARAQDETAAQAVLGGIQLQERGTAQRYEFVMDAEQPARSTVDVRGTVPRTTELRINFESGAVALSGIEGPIHVAHESGNVQIDGARSNVEVHIRNGDIQMGLQTIPPGTTVNLQTANGDLTLGLPAETSAQLTAATQAGAINVQDLQFASRRLQPQGAGARFEARLNAGDATVTLRTENGSITLRGRRDVPLVPADSMTIAPDDTAQSPSVDTIPSTDTTAPADTAAPDTSSETPPDTTAPRP